MAIIFGEASSCVCISGCRFLWEKHSWERAHLELSLLAQEMGAVCSFLHSAKEFHGGNGVRLALWHLRLLRGESFPFPLSLPFHFLSHFLCISSLNFFAFPLSLPFPFLSQFLSHFSLNSFPFLLSIPSPFLS